jgi:hypothetical protein
MVVLTKMKMKTRRVTTTSESKSLLICFKKFKYASNFITIYSIIKRHNDQRRVIGVHSSSRSLQHQALGDYLRVLLCEAPLLNESLASEVDTLRGTKPIEKTVRSQQHEVVSVWVESRDADLWLC